jgi:pyruvate kinase
MQYDISKYVKKGERVYLRDGMIHVEVVKVEKGLVTTQVVAPGILTSNQGMNLPDTDLGGEILTPKDIADIDFAVHNDADYISLSFVQTADDILRLKERLKKLGANMRVIAKIETAAAVENLEAIVAATDGIMVARGDLAIETKPESVPSVQRRLIELCKQQCKTVIVATQMLETMTQSPQPSRAEVSDVATAVLEGADAVMLSGETAMGLFPIETVKMMKRIILFTEREELSKLPDRRYENYAASTNNAISAAAVELATQLPAKVIVAETSSGSTARNIAALRPKMPVIIVTDHARVYQQGAVIWGGKSFLFKDMKDATDTIIRDLKAAGNIKTGDALVVASGSQPGVIGGTNKVEIRIVD